MTVKEAIFGKGPRLFSLLVDQRFECQLGLGDRSDLGTWTWMVGQVKTDEFGVLENHASAGASKQYHLKVLVFQVSLLCVAARIRLQG